MSRERFDIGIVGGGPAGAWAAYLLARSGADVAIFDGSHPREKPCGGGVTARALSLVSDAIEPSRLRSVPVRRAIFREGSRRAVAVPLSSSARSELTVTSRAEFDAALLASAVDAGAVHVARRAIDVRRAPSGFEISTSRGVFRATRLVGADGANSLVRRRLTRAFSREQLSIATGFFAHGVTSDAIELEMVGNPPGYIWSFPRTDHLAIGICAPADASASAGSLRARVNDWIHATGIARGASLTAYSWPIPSLAADDIDSLDVSGEGWMLLGDAAGLVDPITREGIFFALESARLAAAALAGSRQPARTYADSLHGHVLEELARAARLKQGFFQPRFTRLLLDALEQSAGIRAIMADLISGVQGYRGLKRRLASTLELGLALRALAG